MYHPLLFSEFLAFVVHTVASPVAFLLLLGCALSTDIDKQAQDGIDVADFAPNSSFKTYSFIKCGDSCNPNLWCRSDLIAAVFVRPEGAVAPTVSTPAYWSTTRVLRQRNANRVCDVVPAQRQATHGSWIVNRQMRHTWQQGLIAT